MQLIFRDYILSQHFLAKLDHSLPVLMNSQGTVRTASERMTGVRCFKPRMFKMRTGGVGARQLPGQALLIGHGHQVLQEQDDNNRHQGDERREGVVRPSCECAHNAQASVPSYSIYACP